MITRQSVAPAVEPVTLTEAKLHLRLSTSAWDAVEYDTEDDLLNSLIETARGYVENYTHRAIITQTWIAYLETFPNAVRLPFPPFQSITSITVEGVAFTDFTASTEGIIEPDDLWPTLSSDPGANPIEITFISGYGLAVSVPAPIKHAILLLIAHWYSNRESVLIGVNAAPLPMAVEALLNPYRWMQFV